MNRAKGYILLLLLVCLPLSVQARGYYRGSTQSTNHYFGLYAEGAYSMMPLTLQPDIAAIGGYATGIGALYEMRHRRMLLDLGGGFLWQTAGDRLKTGIEWHDPRVDTQGTDYTLDTYIDRHDIIQHGAVDMHLMMGMDLSPMYWLLGVKAGVGVVNHVAMHARVTTTGTYDQYFIPISETDVHGFRNQVDLHPQSANFQMPYDVRLSAEVGAWLGDIRPDANIRTRIAVFVDFGLFTSPANRNHQTVTRTYDFNFDQYEMNPIVTTGDLSMRMDLLTGLKLTVLFGGYGASNNHDCRWCHLVRDDFRPRRYRHKCVICNDNYNR